MRIEADIKLGFQDVMIQPKRSTLRSRDQVDLRRTFTMKYSKHRWTGIPIMAANMDTIGTFEMATQLSEHQMMTVINKHYSVDEWKEYLLDESYDINPDYVAISSGISDNDIKKLYNIIDTFPAVNTICLDVANGYTETFINAVKQTRTMCGNNTTIIAGNVATSEATEALILAGADIVKVGIGSGSVCTTRTKTGVGYPQLSAIIECADAAHGLGGLIISDGGCTVPADIAKAFGAGADFVMLGGMLSGHDECKGFLMETEQGQVKEFYGMSSDVAMEKYMGEVANYRTSEGKRVLVPYKGPVENTILDILGGLRSTCTYVGAKSLKELSKRTTFIRVQQQANEIFTPYNA